MKYEFTGETKVVLGGTLKRIKRSDTGEVGGWIESEANLSMSGTAWVSGDAWVYGNAQVYGDALVSGNARVFGDALVSGNARVFGNAQVYGTAWVSGDAWVYGNARVFGNAQVFGNARVFGNACLLVAGPLGSRSAYITAFKCETGFKVATGCFLGTAEEFMAAVAETHGDNDHARLYRAFVEMAQYKFREESK